MDPLKFTTIAHATHRYLSPLSADKAAWLIGLLGVGPSSRVLDIGCGRAGFLIDVLAATGAHGVGVDLNPAFVDSALRDARSRGVAERLDVRCGPLLERVTAGEHFDAVLCLGSSQAIGTPADALRWMHGALNAQGVALFADGFWRRPPESDYLAALGNASADEMGTHADNARMAREAGFRVLATAAASDDEWDDYEGRYCASVERYVAAHPDDADAPAMADRIRRWHDAYLRHGRTTLGYGYYLLSK